MPKKISQKVNILKKNNNNNYLLIFFESPNRVLSTLEELKVIYDGKKELIIAREITKIYEDINICSINNWIEYYNFNKNEKLKGEFVFIIPKLSPLLSIT